MASYSRTSGNGYEVRCIKHFRGPAQGTIISFTAASGRHNLRSIALYGSNQVLVSLYTQLGSTSAMRQSFFATALCLSLIQTSDARAHGRFPQLQIRDGGAVVQDARHGVVDWFRHLFKKDDSIERRQESICPEDIYFQFVYNSSFGQDFCESFVNYPNTTVTADYTPTRYA